ncbi:MAG: hypothetical protein A2Z75_05105 [Chloroflexi bacterium RBG_13_50_10]|nr:MAG: hypothetical protein A2Z75_05105 [Chloroflexi bacterium RBG_13_50_10]
MKKLILLLLLAVMVTAGCDLTGLTVTTTTESPVINSFGAEPETIAAGGTATLSWSVVGATKVSIDQGIGNVALAGRRAVMPSVTTVYTLTATNAAGVSVPATAQVIVSGVSSPPESAPPESTPTPSAGLPVVNYFMANPPSITAGGSTTLAWNVSNATAVTIDPGVGPVLAVGTAPVSPATSTNYTLTATNAAGSYPMTIAVLVTGAPAAGQPDLIVEDISRSGDKISYKIKNQGDVAAGPSTSTLLVDGAVAANDSVGSLAAGESKTETFTGYTYNCTLPGDALVVKADTGTAVVESSEANNSYTESWSCLILGPVRILKPDLVIEDIWLVPEITGDKIYYKIKNNGAIASGASTSALYIYPCFDPCPPVATDSVASLAAGESRTEKFGAYNYTGLGWSVGVKADYNGVIDESDDGNNSLSKSKADL